jgi:zinc D-Ala-D-Ala dipeptidase
MKKEEVYQELESKMLDYKDYKDMPVQENNDPMVPIIPTANLAARQLRTEMLPYTGEQVYVRSGVARRLAQAADNLAFTNPRYQLEVVYGYRALEIQNRNFERAKKQFEGEYVGDELLAATHRLIAVPEVAGHPAGAAVDLQIIQDGRPLDFGTKIWEFVPDSYTYSPYISKEARLNRELLRTAMMSAGFAPFDGEWWHFSYGDKEWAKHYDRPAAIYEQIDFRVESEQDKLGCRG